MANEQKNLEGGKPEVNLLLPTDMLEAPWWRSMLDNFRAAMAAPTVRGKSGTLSQGDVDLLGIQEVVERPWWQSLGENFSELIHPKKLPPLELTSKPVAVREIWGFYDNRRSGALGSTVVHMLALVAIIGGTILGRRVVAEIKKPTVELVAPSDIADYLPVSSKPNDTIGGGGGGGDRDKLMAPKGKLPKQSMEQFTPPAVVVRNENPKLPVEPTVVVPPQIKLAMNNMPTMGDPLSTLPAGPPSNGTGSGGGIGSGSGGGVGSGTGPGVGPGRGGGIGGGVFRVGGGVSAPRPVSTPDPEYSEEARKAKYQGTCVLWLVVGPDGRPRDIKIARSLGLGLDEKAIEAVRQWRFEPAMKDGKPVAVQINVEVSFRLY
jgi:periplasmic protein TonB